MAEVWGVEGVSARAQGAPYRAIVRRQIYNFPLPWIRARDPGTPFLNNALLIGMRI